MSSRDPKSVDAELVSLVQELSRRAGREASEIEVRAALAPLVPAEEKVLRRLGRGAPPATPLGPMAWADLARGEEPSVAAARELGGYYQLLAERDALAAMVLPGAEPPPAPAATRPAPPADRPRKKRAAASDEADTAPEPALPESPARKLRGQAHARAQQILGMFAYHRDAPRVAQALKLSLPELEEEIHDLGLRRKAARLVRGTDFDLPVAQPTAAQKSGPPLRRSIADKAGKVERAAAATAAKLDAAKLLESSGKRASTKPAPRGVTSRVDADVAEARIRSEPKAARAPRFPPRPTASREFTAAPPAPARPAALMREKAPALPPKPAPPEQRLNPKMFSSEAEYLKALLAQVGPRRKQLAERLGLRNEPLPERVMLARFRGAGLDRELGQRERDLVRGLYKRHHGSNTSVAAELGLPLVELAAIVKERGLDREVEAIREGHRREVRAAVWPRARIELLLQRRGWLSDLGILRELEDEIRTRVRIAWEKLRPEDLSQTKAVDVLGQELLLEGADARALSKLFKLG